MLPPSQQLFLSLQTHMYARWAGADPEQTSVICKRIFQIHHITEWLFFLETYDTGSFIFKRSSKLDYIPTRGAETGQWTNMHFFILRHKRHPVHPLLKIRYFQTQSSFRQSVLLDGFGEGTLLREREAVSDRIWQVHLLIHSLPWTRSWKSRKKGRGQVWCDLWATDSYLQSEHKWEVGLHPHFIEMMTQS